MNYWPLSTIKQSPLMPPTYAWELCRFSYQIPSLPAFEACMAVARQTTPIAMQGLIVIESTDTSGRFAYTERPSLQEWTRLERIAAVETAGGFLCMIMDALH